MRRLLVRPGKSRPVTLPIVSHLMSLSLTELKEKSTTELADVARSLKLDNVTRLRRQDQIIAILKSHAKRG